MVFLGGAVLANIVSPVLVSAQLNTLTMRRWLTRKTCGYPKRSGRSKAQERWRSSVRDDEHPENGSKVVFSIEQANQLRHSHGWSTKDVYFLAFGGRLIAAPAFLQPASLNWENSLLRYQLVRTSRAAETTAADDLALTNTVVRQRSSNRW
jgi:hypothetical protein